MHEVVVLLIVVAVCMAVATFFIHKVGALLGWVEYFLLCVSVAVILFVMLFVGAEVMMRYVFNAPIQGHLEGSELLMPIIVFLALSYAQATHAHVGMDLVLDSLPASGRRYAVMATLLVSMFVCAVLAYFAAKNALQLYEYDDVTMTPPYFRTWPAAAAIPLGYMLCTIRMYVQILHLWDPQRFPEFKQREYTVETMDS